MIILGIETSCDETAISIVEINGEYPDTKLNILSHNVLSQVKIHQEFGGVFPALAKREHAKNLVPILDKSLEDAGMKREGETKFDEEEIGKTLEREPELFEQFAKFIRSHKKPEIDKIAVTYGPGLEPALWVGINFAKALSKIWNIPITAVNHMEGHIFASLLDGNKLRAIEFPALALLISGGHTEIALIESLNQYKIVGETVDDAVGEAYDKVARLLDLPYPGGPEISRLADKAREANRKSEFSFPRPMINTDNLNFSFSGLKTSVLYKTKELGALDQRTKEDIALEFENAVSEVIVKKVKNAIDQFSANTLIAGGGVAANKNIRSELTDTCENIGIKLILPDPKLTTDNALMIAVAGYYLPKSDIDEIQAKGNLRIDS